MTVHQLQVLIGSLLVLAGVLGIAGEISVKLSSAISKRR